MNAFEFLTHHYLISLSTISITNQKEKRLDIFVYKYWDAHPTDERYKRAGYYLWNDKSRGDWPKMYISDKDHALPTKECHMWDVQVSCPRHLDVLTNEYSRSSVHEAKMWSHSTNAGDKLVDLTLAENRKDLLPNLNKKMMESLYFGKHNPILKYDELEKQW